MPLTPTPPPAPPVPFEPPQRLKDLVSFRMNILVGLWTRLASETNQREFGVDKHEWRILGLLGGYAPMSLQGLACEAKVDKSQASRSISGLIERGLVRRESDASDGRGVQLSLTPEGKALYRKIFSRAVKRNEDQLSVLDPQERVVLESALARLTVHAQEALATHRERPAETRRA